MSTPTEAMGHAVATEEAGETTISNLRTFQVAVAVQTQLRNDLLHFEENENKLRSFFSATMDGPLPEDNEKLKVILNNYLGNYLDSYQDALIRKLEGDPAQFDDGMWISCAQKTAIGALKDEYVTISNVSPFTVAMQINPALEQR